MASSFWKLSLSIIHSYSLIVGIKKYIVGLIIKISSDAVSLEREKMYLTKLNMILVQVSALSWYCIFDFRTDEQIGIVNLFFSLRQVLKREWPKNWQSFIPDIVGASKTNESLCQNNMIILKLLSEEVFDFSTGQITQTKAKHLKDTMCSEFSQIFQLCQFVLVSGHVTVIKIFISITFHHHSNVSYTRKTPKIPLWLALHWRHYYDS